MLELRGQRQRNMCHSLGNLVSAPSYKPLNVQIEDRGSYGWEASRRGGRLMASRFEFPGSSA